mgnify:CR=1 FL=1
MSLLQNKKTQNEESCFGCGRRRGPLKKSDSTAVVVPSREFRITIEHRQVNTPTSRIDRWRVEESCIGVLWRILEGSLIVIIILSMMIFYGKIIQVLADICNDNESREWNEITPNEGINVEFYFIGLILSLLSCCACITCQVIYSERIHT